MIMGNIPLALEGCIITLQIAGAELSVVSLIGFIAQGHDTSRTSPM